MDLWCHSDYQWHTSQTEPMQLKGRIGLGRNFAKRPCLSDGPCISPLCCCLGGSRRTVRNERVSTRPIDETVLDTTTPSDTGFCWSDSHVESMDRGQR